MNLEIEALWTADFVSDQPSIGGGVVIFETGRVFGGDAQYYYVGNYEMQGANISGRINIKHYRGEPYSVFGNRDAFTVVLSGKYSASEMIIYGHLEEDPSRTLAIKLTRRTSLP